MTMKQPPPPKKPVVKDEAWRRAALRYSALIITLGLLGGTCLGLQIAKVEKAEQEAAQLREEVPQP